MNSELVYFLFTDTGTHLSRVINFCTQKSLNHVSIAFDEELSEVYSFGRTQPNNPFSGGFVREDIHNGLLKQAQCAIYSYEISREKRDRILANIKEIEANKAAYRYNFMGLIGVLLHVDIKRKQAFFCSEFIATMLTNAETVSLSKPNHFITPEDIRREVMMTLLYTGELANYQASYVTAERKRATDPVEVKQSVVFILSQKMKRLIIK